MKYSKLHTKVNKKAKKLKSVNATLLQKAGFIHQTMAGVYTFLPLGLKVLNKIENIVREEMDKIGVELLMPAISPKKLWETTGRLEEIDVLFKVVGANKISRLRNDSEYILNPTQEDLITPIAKMFNTSYRDFPFAYYHIQNKFRNEPRSKSGIMRGREFRMKDLYSFHTSEKDLLDYYHNVVKPAYIKLFDRLGIGKETFITLASGGDFTKDFSHEFQTKCDAGEDWVFYSKEKDIYYNREVTPSKATLPAEMESEEKELEEVYGENITGMEELVKFLKISANRCVKTLVYIADGKEVIVVAVRGDYDINEEKVRKVLDVSKLELADKETVKRTTGAEMGYAGIINLPDNVRKVFDDSIEGLKNFECGTNKTNYHTININWERDLEKPEKFFDIKVAKEGDQHPETEEIYEVFKAAEVGNIFPLNTKFTKAFDYKFTDKDGKQKEIYMGSYGIGTSRIMGVLVEKFHDDKGIIWPESVAPFKVHLTSINKTGDKVKKRADEIYNILINNGVEVLYDDRDDASPGEKFGDADLIGIPWRIVVSDKTGDKVELKRRESNESTLFEVEELLKKL